MSSNGTDRLVKLATVETMRRHTRTVADLSSTERSSLLDAVVAQLEAVTVAHNRLAQCVEAQGKQITALTDDSREHAHRIMEARVESASFLARPFVARLRWFLGR
jgi:hypothetical protein